MTDDSRTRTELERLTEFVKRVKSAYLRTATWHSPATARPTRFEAMLAEERQLAREQVRDEFRAELMWLDGTDPDEKEKVTP